MAEKVTVKNSFEIVFKNDGSDIPLIVVTEAGTLRKCRHALLATIKSDSIATDSYEALQSKEVLGTFEALSGDILKLSAKLVWVDGDDIYRREMTVGDMIARVKLSRSIYEASKLDTFTIVKNDTLKSNDTPAPVTVNEAGKSIAEVLAAKLAELTKKAEAPSDTQTGTQTDNKPNEAEAEAEAPTGTQTAPAPVNATKPK